mmetsp:Transcript_11180/g.24645  ORF Transcript_11180/g.24645 Transcript_11180/m.24645 type:complete len:265 (+) Transcript_11180:311-1105(+)
MIGLFCNHVQNVSETLRAPLSPGLVHPERHVLCTLFPAQKLNISLALVCTICIVEARPGKHTDNLRKFHYSFCEGSDTVLKVLEGLLIDLRVQNIMNSIHLGFPILLVGVPLLLHLPNCICRFLNVHFMACTFYSQSINFFTKLQNVTLMFAQTALHPAHTEVKCAQPSRCFGASQLGLLFHLTNLLECLLLLLADVVFEARFGISHVAFQVGPHDRDLVETIREGILCGVQRLLSSGKILIREVNPTIQSINSLVCVACNLRF